MKIAVASGKGGTGKTTLSINLFHTISLLTDKKIQLVDCDVEEPNDALFFKNPDKSKQTDAFQLIPEIEIDKCTFCKKCSSWCEFNAITIVPKLEFAEINESLCHSCGACSVACPEGAITEKEKSIGTITQFQIGEKQLLTEGRLNVGSAMQTSLIKKVKNSVQQNNSITIYDAPPGTSCPVVETVADADYVVLVAEPTPFGLHDLKITVELIEKLKKPFGIVINKAGLGDNKIYQFLEKKQIEILGEIPFDKQFAESYSTGKLLEGIPEKAADLYRGIAGKILHKEVVE